MLKLHHTFFCVLMFWVMLQLGCTLAIQAEIFHNCSLPQVEYSLFSSAKKKKKEGASILQKETETKRGILVKIMFF